MIISKYKRDKLLNCPYCGGEPMLERSFRAFVDGKSTKVAFVRCTNCNARSGRVNLSDYGHTSNSNEAENKAIELWNRRV